MSRPLPVHEEHGEVVGTWRALGYRNETVVCFDRHLDLKPLGEAAIRQIQSARGVGELRALNRPLPMREAPGAFGLDDFFAVGPVLEAVRTLWWVMPGVWPNDRVRVSHALDTLARIPVDPDTLARTRVVDGVLCTRLCGLDLQVHSLETLQVCGVPADSRVDIDLDWLADGETPPQHTPFELVELLDTHGCVERLDSLTWSVRSGFLSNSMRNTASQVADAIGRSLAPVAWDGVWPSPERTLAALRGRLHKGQRAQLQIELAPLGAIGIALDGCLAVKEGAVQQAEAAWRRAAEAGIRSSWLAHGIGLAWYKREPLRALEWLERATGMGMDTLEVHAASLTLMCLLHLGRIDEARLRVKALVKRHPLHRKLVRIGALIAVGDTEHAWYSAQERFIDGLIQVEVS